jgi:hypothetical protein
VCEWWIYKTPMPPQEPVPLMVVNRPGLGEIPSYAVCSKKC